MLSFLFTLHNNSLFILKYSSTENQGENTQQREQRKQKIIWFNPPHSLNVKTDVGKLFLKLLDGHFLRTHKIFHKIFNRSTIKISYCCMKNMGSVMSFHNKQIFQPHNENYGYKCRKRKPSVRQQICLTPNIICEAQIINNTNDEHKKYLGAAKIHLKKDIATTREILNIKSI